MNSTDPSPERRTFVQGLGLLDATMLVAGSMIGSGIFIVSADMTRQLGSGGWLLLGWIATGLLTVAAALSYGELAAMMPHAGGQYVFLREAYSPLWGFLYGWTSFLVIQTGTIAAVAVAFARYLGELAPAISPTNWIIRPIHLGSSYALSLSTQQLIAIVLIVALTVINTRGLEAGKWIQNFFTSAKTLCLAALILIGIVFFRQPAAIQANFHDFWTPRNAVPIRPELGLLPEVTAAAGALGLFIAFCVAQVGSLFSADAWNNVTFTAAEVKNPRRNLPLALALGTGLVTLIYVLVNVAYLCLLPLEQIRYPLDDRLATAAIATVFHSAPLLMAIAIMISTFGCNNGLILSGARVYYAMAQDKLFFQPTSRLNSRGVPAAGLWLQAIWTCVLVLPRTVTLDVNGAPKYGNLYSDLLDYVVFAVLIFYVLTIVGLFLLRRKQPNANRPYRAFGYPVVPALYILGASAILIVLLLYKTKTTWPGLAIVLAGVPVYALWAKKTPPAETQPPPEPAAEHETGTTHRETQG
jgi:basic amino acid/polyamine antiporter, APA family